MQNICRKNYMSIRFLKNECHVANTILQSRDRFNLALLQCNIIDQIVISQPKFSECHCFTAMVKILVTKIAALLHNLHPCLTKEWKHAIDMLSTIK